MSDLSGSRRRPARPETTTDDPIGVIEPFESPAPLRVAPLIQTGDGLAVRRSLSTVIDGFTSPATVEGQRHLARLLNANGIDSVTPSVPSAAPVADGAPAAEPPPPGDLRARLMALTQSGPEPFVFVRYRRRAVAPAPPTAGLAVIPASEVDPMAPTAAREMAAAADPGVPLRDEQRAPLESVVGTSTDGVRIHTGARAMATAAALRAEAFTIGRDIFFRQGRFEPSTARGQALLAHELVHVRQESEATRGTPGPRGDREATEAAAEAAERFVLAIQPSGSAGQVTVGKLIRNYSTSSGRSISRQESERLDTISMRALDVCERLLGPEVSRLDERQIGNVRLQLRLDLGQLSDDQAAEIWGRALAEAVRQKIRL